MSNAHKHSTHIQKPDYAPKPKRYKALIGGFGAILICLVIFIWRQPLFSQATNDDRVNVTAPQDNPSETTSPSTTIAVVSQPATTTPLATATAEPKRLAFVLTEKTATPSPVPSGYNFTLKPVANHSGWVSGNENSFTTIFDTPNNFQDETFLYTGSFEGEIYHGAFQFDVSHIPRGTRFHSASVTLTGIRDDQLKSEGQWQLHLLVPEVNYNWLAIDYKQLHTTLPWVTLHPTLTSDQLGIGVTNVFEFTQEQLIFLEHHHLAGSDHFAFRLDGPEVDNNLFAWQANGKEAGPKLFLSIGPPPEVTPDVAYVLITSTPTAENLETAVANSLSLTAEATRIGTATPLPPNWVTPIVVTPTPTAENEATAQVMYERGTAIALTTGEAKNVVTATATPTYVLVTSTPTPKNVMTAAAVSVQLTAKATQVGTGTPLPKNFVTPIVVTSSPTPINQATIEHQQALATAQAITLGTITATPANQITATPTPTYVVITSVPTPETIETAVARSVALTAEATQVGTATPLPKNWVTPIIVTSTSTPANEATVAFRQAIIFTTGTPTPEASNVQTATPTAVFTPVGPFVDPTATVTPSPIPPALPEVLQGKIVFLSDREGTDETARSSFGFSNTEPIIVPQAYFFDPETEEYGRLSDIWPYEVATKREAWSADRRFITFTADDGQDRPAIFWFDTHYNAGQQLSQFGVGIAYDGAWSPVSESIAFVSTESKNDEIWTINRDGSNLRQLTGNTWEWDKHPSWSPNGNKIVFYSNRTGNNQIWVMNADGSEQRLLMPANEYSDWNPVWIKYLDSAPAEPKNLK
ncbi:MAG: hypothetical protein AAF629_34045 [Chloroflexota bacterium]